MRDTSHTGSVADNKRRWQTEKETTLGRSPETRHAATYFCAPVQRRIRFGER
jgi:hypothetical protein